MNEQQIENTSAELRALSVRLATLLDYPTEGFHAEVDAIDAALPGLCTAAVPGWSTFRAHVGPMALDGVRELYVQTFELSAACTLEVGYHLFGESYKRGEFLAGLSREESGLGIDAGGQLPDYLPLLLRLYPALDDDELRETLRVDCLIPSIQRMIEKLAATENPYAGILRALSSSLGAEEILQSEPEETHA